MRINLTFYFLILACSIHGQGIPDIDWSKAGRGSDEDLDFEYIDFKEYKATFTADVTDDALMKNIIHDHPNGATIFFAKGEYHFTKQIRLSSNYALKGTGENSILYFDLEKEQDCILAQGKLTDITYKVEGGFAKGSNVFPCQVENDIHAGDYIYFGDKDGHLTTSSWAEGKSGQIFQVWVKSDKQIKVHGYARRDFSEKNGPMIYKLDLVENVKIEKLKIVNNTATSGQTSNIRLSYVINSVVGGVTSEKCNYTHVLLEFSSNCEIMGCHFANAHDFGNGGKGYGVTLQFAACDNLVIGNHFNLLRHAMLLQAGANGNVLYHNTSTNPYWTDVRLPNDAAGDIVLHGNYVYANLIENNDVQTIVVDKTHGPNGPDNLFYNNKMSGYGIYIHRKSLGQVVIQNEIKDLRWPKGRYRVRGKQIESDNKVGKKTKPRRSLKLDLKESYWL